MRGNPKDYEGNINEKSKNDRQLALRMDSKPKINHRQHVRRKCASSALKSTRKVCHFAESWMMRTLSTTSATGKAMMNLLSLKTLAKTMMLRSVISLLEAKKVALGHNRLEFRCLETTMEALHVSSPSLHENSFNHEFLTAGLDELQDDEGLELDLNASFTGIAHTGFTGIAHDPDSELEALRKSVHRLREQRHAVVRLKDFASKSNAKAATLERELKSVRQQLHKLQQDSARQTSLQRAVAELRDALKQQQQATSEKVSKPTILCQ